MQEIQLACQKLSQGPGGLRGHCNGADQPQGKTPSRSVLLPHPDEFLSFSCRRR